VGGIWLQRDNSRMVNCTAKNIGGGGIGFGVQGTAGSADNTLIYNCIVDTCMKRQQAGGGIGGAFGGGIVLRRNSVISCGNGTLLSHAMYVYDIAGANSYIEFNYMYDGANLGITSHGNESNIFFRWTDIHKCGNGIGFQSGYSTAESMDDVTIAFNRVREVGLGTNQTQGYGILLNACPRMTVYGNLVFKPRIGGLSVNQSSSGGADAYANNVKIWNNTFYCNGESTFYVMEVSGANLTAIDVRNNIFYNGTTNSSRYTFSKVNTPDSEVTLSNNLHYRPNSGSSSLISWDGTARTLAYVQGTLNKDAGAISADPQFYNVGGDKYRLKSTSPCKGAGTPVAAVLDFFGNARHATLPSIGCFE
jgi:hypothetical protein